VTRAGGLPAGSLHRGEASAWPREDLVRRLRLALHVAGRAIAVLAEDGYRDDELPEESFAPDKPLAETAMLLYVASSVDGEPELAETIDELSAVVATHARSPRTAIALAIHPSICLQLAMPHVLLSRLGRKDAGFDRLLAAGLNSSARRGHEVVPHRMLETAWLESLWRGAPVAEALDAAAQSSVLTHPLDLLSGTREDAYAHTHALMYFTDFGYAGGRPLPRPRREILAESGGVLARSLLLEDYDLAAEALMAWPLTRTPWSPAAAFGFRVLAELEDAVGFLPAKNGTPEKFTRLEGAERTRYALASSYHTVYVMGMLCALALRSPPALLTDGALARADELLALIPETDTPWRRTFERLTPSERGSLSSFLLDVALLDSARRNDFGSVARLLELAVRDSIADTPLCSQSAELLQRIAVAAEVAQEP
jgi:Domain of unknown function (DUF6895)